LEGCCICHELLGRFYVTQAEIVIKSDLSEKSKEEIQTNFDKYIQDGIEQFQRIDSISQIIEDKVCVFEVLFCSMGIFLRFVT
jgi:hypothetical protein